MTKIVQDLTRGGKISPSILIGIGYSEEQRSRLTLDAPAAFYAYFRQELIPQIESKFRVGRSGRDRLLFGYSGSAHFSTYTLFADVCAGVETFNKIISISGVYSTELEAARIEEKLFTEQGACSFAGRSLFIAVGSDDPKDWLLDAHRMFTQRLANRGYTEFNLIITEFPGKGHYDIPEFGFREGLLGIY
jgi:enterochelin esterase-like enzyme